MSWIRHPNDGNQLINLNYIKEIKKNLSLGIKLKYGNDRIANHSYQDDMEFRFETMEERDTYFGILEMHLGVLEL